MPEKDYIVREKTGCSVECAQESLSILISIPH